MKHYTINTWELIHTNPNVMNVKFLFYIYCGLPSLRKTSNVSEGMRQ